MYAALGLLIGLVLFGLADALLYIAQKKWKGRGSPSSVISRFSFIFGVVSFRVVRPARPD